MPAHKMTSRDAALRAVGRTVVNFQRLEHNLKAAARLQPVQGTILKIQRDIARRDERTATLTLGQAIQAWLNACEGEKLATSYTPDMFDAHIQMTFSLGSDTESRSAHAASLKALLETRNNLFHGALVQFQWDSPEECDRLVMQLDEVNQAIGTQIEYLNTVLTAVRTIRPEDLELTQTEVTTE